MSTDQEKGTFSGKRNIVMHSPPTREGGVGRGSNAQVTQFHFFPFVRHPALLSTKLFLPVCSIFLRCIFLHTSHHTLTKGQKFEKVENEENLICVISLPKKF